MSLIRLVRPGLPVLTVDMVRLPAVGDPVMFRDTIGGSEPPVYTKWYVRTFSTVIEHDSKATGDEPKSVLVAHLDAKPPPPGATSRGR